MKKILTLSTIFSLVLSFSIALPALAESPEPNPTLGDACDGLDIALVIDKSGSIGDTNMATVRTAAKDFVNAFLSNTPSTIGVVSFDSSATTHLGLTNNVTDLETAIGLLASGGNTNWEDGLLHGRELLETPPNNPDDDDRSDDQNPDLMVVFTDGAPNVSSGPGTDLEDAIAQADLAKTSGSSQPIRIIVVGVGGAIQANLEAISGTNVATDPGDITLDTDVIMTDFTNLGTTLANLATALCDQPPEDCHDCGNTINIIANDNAAIVVNNVSVVANTGGNYADGSYGGNGGNGGDIENGRSHRGGGNQLDAQNHDDEGGEVDDSTTGNGGAGGDSGRGGTVIPGDAEAESAIGNVVNYNQTEIENCCDENCCANDDVVRPEGGCCLEGPIDLNIVYNRNRAIVANRGGAVANTGDNVANGSYAGEGGNGGDIENSGDEVDESGTGNGGAGGDSGAGGWVETGRAVSRSGAVNMINTNITRITRAD